MKRLALSAGYWAGVILNLIQNALRGGEKKAGGSNHQPTALISKKNGLKSEWQLVILKSAGI